MYVFLHQNIIVIVAVVAVVVVVVVTEHVSHVFFAISSSYVLLLLLFVLDAIDLKSAPKQQAFCLPHSYSLAYLHLRAQLLWLSTRIANIFTQMYSYSICYRPGKAYHNIIFTYNIVSYACFPFRSLFNICAVQFR